MPIRRSLFSTLALAGAAALAHLSAALAQDPQPQDPQPLSAIDWLSRNAPANPLPAAQPAPGTAAEPAVADTATAPSVTVVPLDDAVRRRTGLLPFAVTGLAPDLWLGSDVDDLQRQLRAARDQALPAGKSLLFSLLLAEADDTPNDDAALAWTIARIAALRALGAVDPALALVRDAEPSRAEPLFELWFDLALLDNGSDAPCAALAERPALTTRDAARIWCAARGGDYDTAALLFGTADALGVLPEPQATLLARFLDPELFEEDALPRAPLRPDALTFRLFEAAGAPLATAPLPRPFAHADLGEDAGWKAQLEAAERLARAGALPSNQLLGLYTARLPAASGGIWDRVQALQRFEAALRAQDPEAVSRHLPAMWRGMQAAGLEVAFSDLFAEQLAALRLDGPASDVAYRLQLLSAQYENAALPATPSTAEQLMAGIAAGAPDETLAQTPYQRAVARAFSDATPPSATVAALQPGTLGSTVLDVLDRLKNGGRGDAAAIETALVDLRALGLEDVARRAALQALILKEDL